MVGLARGVIDVHDGLFGEGVAGLHGRPGFDDVYGDRCLLAVDRSKVVSGAASAREPLPMSR